MKQATTIIAAVAAALFANAAPLIVPKTNPETAFSTPLKTGEVAYMDERNGSVSMFIGDEGETKPVADPMSVRGYTLEILDRSEASIVWDTEIAYDNELDEWTLCGHWAGSQWINTLNVTNRIIITCRSHVRIADIVFDSVNQSPRIGTPPCGSITTEINGNVAIIYCVKTEAGDFSISDLAIYEVANGNTEWVNDLTKLVVPTVDSMGESQLGKWREWAYHCRAGNLGQDWSKYHASNNVTVANGCQMAFDGKGTTKGRYAIRQNNANELVVKAGDTNAIEVAFHGIASNSLCFTSVKYDAAADKAYLGWNLDADSVDLTKLTVYYKQHLTNATWTAAANAQKAIGIVTVPGVSNLVSDARECYWRLGYDAQVTRMLKTTINGELWVNGQFFLKGEDGQMWGIRIQPGGNITAIAVNQ